MTYLQCDQWSAEIYVKLGSYRRRMHHKVKYCQYTELVFSLRNLTLPVAQLVDRSLPVKEVHSHPFISKHFEAN